MNALYASTTPAVATPATPATPAAVTFDAAAFAALSPWKGITDDTDPKILALIDLSSKESYLAWVAAWKTEYKACSARIRSARAAFRTAGATGESMSFAVKEPLLRERALARTMLTARRAGKRESWARAQAMRAAAAQA